VADPTDREGGGTARAIGRADVPEAVERTLSEAASGTGRGLLLRGAAGTGKSQFLRAAIARARDRGFRVASGHGLPDELPAPFALVRELVASLESETEAAHAPSAEGGEPLFPGASGAGPGRSAPDASPRPTPTTDGLERILAPRGRTAVEGLAASRSRLIATLTEFILDQARSEPLLLAIDDLAFVDRSSLDFLAWFARELTGSRVAFVATVGEESQLPESVRAPIASIAGAPAFRSVVVRPMNLAEVMEFSTLLLDGTPPSADEVQRWYAETGGNPLFVEQMVRSMLGRVGGGAGAAPVPDSLAALLLQRVRSLDDPERRVLTYAAVLGREFEFRRLLAVVGLDEDRLTEVLDRLVQAGLVRERSGEVYEFVSEVVRTSVYADLTETRRRILHRKVAVALEARGGAGDFELARQFYLGRDDTKTVEYNLKAAEAATQSFAFEAAVSHLARALEGERRRPNRDPRLEVRLLTEQGRLLQEAGDLAQSEEVLRRGIELGRALPPDGAELGRALLAYAWTRVDRSDYTSAESLATEAIDRLSRHGTPRDVFSAHRVLGTVYWRTGDVPRTEQHQRAALEFAEREGTPSERGHALVDVANALFPLGHAQFENALALYDRAAGLFATAEDPASQARVMMNRAVLEYSVGKRTEAFGDVVAALEAAEQARAPLWVGMCLINFAQWKAEEGDLATARGAIDRAERTFAPMGEPLADQQIAMVRGMIAEGGEFYDEAELQYGESLAAARKLGLASETAELLFRLARLAYRRDDRAGARARAAEARSNGLAVQRPDLIPQLEEIEQAAGPGG